MKKYFITFVFVLVSMFSYAQMPMTRPMFNTLTFNRFDMTQYVIEDSLILERVQTYVPDDNLIKHVQEKTGKPLKENQIIQLGENEYMFELPNKDKIMLKYNKDKTKAIITNNSIIQGMGLHFFEFNIKDNERRTVFYYDDDNILCGMIYDKYYKVAKYFRNEKKEIGKRQFNRMRRSFRQSFGPNFNFKR